MLVVAGAADVVIAEPFALDVAVAAFVVSAPRVLDVAIAMFLVDVKVVITVVVVMFRELGVVAVGVVVFVMPVMRAVHCETELIIFELGAWCLVGNVRIVKNLPAYDDPSRCNRNAC